MKIAHIATGYPIRFHGGITNYVRTLAESQVIAGHDVSVVAAPDKNDRSPLPFKEIPFQTRAMRPFSLRVVADDAEADRLAGSLVGGSFDLLHFHMGLDLALNFYERLAQSGIPYVVSVHDYYLVCPRITMIDYQGAISRSVDLEKCSRCIGILDQVDLLEKARRQLHVTLPRLRSKAIYTRDETMRKFLRNSAVALPVSTRVQEIVSAVEPEARYQVMHIGNASAKADIPKKVESERLRVVFLGMLSAHKGADVVRKILQAVRRDDMEFHFYGRAEPHTLKMLTALGLIHHGSYKPADLPDIMSRTDLGLVCPIWEDNAPQVVMEFLNFGVPVIGSRMGGIPDFVNDRNGMLFDPYSEEDIATLVERLGTLSRAEVERMAAATQKLKTPEQHASEMLALYEGIVHGGR